MRSRTLLLIACVTIIGCGRPAVNPAPPFAGLAPGGGAPGAFADDEPLPAERKRVADGPPIKSFRELLAAMPEEKQPKLGPEAVIERNEAKAWLRQNALDKAVEFTVDVRGIDIQDAGEDLYNLDLLIRDDPKTEETKRLGEGIKIDSLKIGTLPCDVILRGPMPLWTDVDAANARKYRELKNKQVVFQGFIDEAEFQEADGGNAFVLRVVIADPSVVRAEKPK